MNRIGLFMVLGWGVSAGAAPHEAAGGIGKPLAVEPLIQESHAGYESAFSVSSDGRWVVSAGDVGQLWNGRGELLRDLDSPTFRLGAPIFAPDNRRFFLSGPEGTAIYALPSGQKLREFKNVEVSADGRFFIRHNGEEVRFSDVRNGQRLGAIQFGKSSEGFGFYLSPDGRLVAGFKDVGRVGIWNVKTGKLVQTLADPRGYMVEDEVTTPVLWSRDGKTLVTGGEDPNWKPVETAEVGREGDALHSHAVKVWNVQTGKLLHVWSGYGNNEEGVALLEWVSPHEVSVGGAIFSVVNIENGKRRKESDSPVSTRNHIVYLNYYIHRFELRDPGGTKTLQKYPLRSFADFSHLSYSPDGTILAAAGDYNSGIGIYDAHTGVLTQTLSTHGEGVVSMRWLANGNLVASSNQNARIWNAKGVLLHYFVAPKKREGRQYSDYNGGVSVSGDGEIYLTYADPSREEEPSLAHVWNSKGELLRDISGFGAGKISKPEEARVHWIDSARVAFTVQSGVTIWNVKTGEVEAALDKSAAAHSLRPVEVSPDGRFLLCCEEVEELKARAVLFETKSWARVRSYENCVPLAWSGDSSKFVAQSQVGAKSTLIFSPQSDLAQSDLAQSDLAQSDLAQSDLAQSDLAQSDKPLQSGAPVLNGPYDTGLEGLAFSPDLGFVARFDGYPSTHTEIRRVGSGKVAVSLYLFGDANQKAVDARSWLALTPSNFYNGAPDVEKWLRWRRNGKLLPVGALQAVLKRPAKVRAALQ